MWTDLPRPAVIAHRGDKMHAPENTLAAFRMAAEKGADAIEFDVQLTADGQVVVIHDQTVDRTTNGTGRVSRIPLAAIRELDAGAWFSEKFRGERIPTLDEVFETFRKKIYMNIELKNFATPFDNLVSKVVYAIRKHGVRDRTLLSSFLPHNLRKARSLQSDIPRGILIKPGLLGFWGCIFGWRTDYFAHHPNISEVNSRLIARVHAKGKRVNVWTVNTEEDLKRMVGFGVDAIITGDLELVLRSLGRSQ
jgi:glycerophosphoryl diester phosphodiesterase